MAGIFLKLHLLAVVSEFQYVDKVIIHFIEDLYLLVHFLMLVDCIVVLVSA